MAEGDFVATEEVKGAEEGYEAFGGGAGGGAAGGEYAEYASIT